MPASVLIHLRVMFVPSQHIINLTLLLHMAAVIANQDIVPPICAWNGTLLVSLKSARMTAGFEVKQLSRNSTINLC